jgi:TonB family protein
MLDFGLCRLSEAATSYFPDEILFPREMWCQTRHKFVGNCMAWSLFSLIGIEVGLILVLFAAGCQSPSPRCLVAEAPSLGAEQPAADSVDPDRPAPVLPQIAMFLGEYAALELTITAARDGSVQRVEISKPSRAKLYDQYTRDWVEKHWKMPVARAGEPDARKFIAPIVYPKPPKLPDGYFPAPGYPAEYLDKRLEGLVIVDLMVAPSGMIETARTVLSSGHKGLDAYTADWARKKWKFPPGERRCYRWPVTYMLR